MPETWGPEDGDVPVEAHEGSEDSWGSELEDPLLRRMARIEPLLRVPRRGERLGGHTGARFVIQEQLGSGGMGRVFRAWDEELQRVVALKFLWLHARAADEGLLALLREEARALARLDHENIVRIFDVSEWTGRPWEPSVPFLVMEYLRGESLESFLRRGRPGLHRALELLRAITAGLAHAHAHGIIHRDLKPSNVFLLGRGQVKLIDFGLALSVEGASSTDPFPSAAGTPPYMAPEQWRGERQDARTDLWAAGVLLYQLLTGELPYPGMDDEELSARVTSEEPMPSACQREPALPQAVEPLLRRALSKEPSRRFSTAAEFHEALSRLAEKLGAWREESRSLGPQRRQVTLVCCRLEGLAGPSPASEEEGGELEAAFQRCCVETLQQHGGAIASCIGEQVLACFGYPLSQEEDAKHAVSAGLHLVTALRRELPRLAVQVGVHTDTVVLEDSSTAVGMGTPALQGEAPGLTEWLARHAGPDTVVLSGTTWSLVRGAFKTRALAPLAYEGRAGARELERHRVLRERRSLLRFSRLRLGGLTPLVGRERELRQLTACWEAARSGRGVFVLLSGEAGLGKSRLIRELRQRVAPEPHTGLRCQCWEEFHTSAFYPVAEMLQHSFRLAPGDPPARRLRVLEERLGALGLTPEQVRLLAALLSLPVAEAPHPSPRLQKERTFEALGTLLQRLAERRPVLAIIEDVHWADPSTRELLGFLLGLVEGQRLCVLVSARPDFQASWLSGAALQRVTLERLPADDTAALVRNAARGRELPPEVVEQLVARTDGIPLFAEELTRMVLEHPRLGLTRVPKLPSSIPMNLRALLLARLDRLPHRHRALAQLCALVGRGFDLPLLAALTHRSEAALKQELAVLLEAGLLQRQDASGGHRYEFRHALIQEAASQSLPLRVRQQHHRRIAQELAQRFREVPETRPELLAHHHTEAGDMESAIQWWSRAGERASHRSANTEAVSHFTRALELLGQLPGSPERARQELRLRTALGLPLLQLQGHGSAEVERTYERAWALIGEVGDALPGVELSYWGLFHYFGARARFERLRELGARLVELGRRQGSPELLALGHRASMVAAFVRGDYPRALEHVQRALEHSDFDLERHQVLAARHGVNPRVAELSFASLLHALTGRLELSRQYTREARALAERILHPHTSTFALAHAAFCSQLLREPLRARAWADESLALACEHRFPLWTGWSMLIRAWAATGQDAIQEGLEVLREGYARARDADVRAGLPLLFAARAELYWKVGRTQEGLDALRQAREWADTTDQRFYEAEQHRLEGELLWQGGREQEAEACFAHAISLARQQHARLFELRATVSLSRWLQARGRTEEARRHLEALRAGFAPDLECEDLSDARWLLARLPPRPG